MASLKNGYLWAKETGFAWKMENDDEQDGEKLT
jgi:hypothetical protein